jgi:hypothetical protein
MTFGFLIYPGAEEMDFLGPWEILGMGHKYHGGPKPVLISRRMEPVTCAHDGTARTAPPVSTYLRRL